MWQSFEAASIKPNVFKRDQTLDWLSGRQVRREECTAQSTDRRGICSAWATFGTFT
jgi:hypothetical protein